MNKTEYLVTYGAGEHGLETEDKIIDSVNYYDLRKLLELVIEGKIYDLYITNSAARPAIFIDEGAARALKMIISDFHDRALQSLQDELAN